jgi:hypothetical protein
MLPGEMPPTPAPTFAYLAEHQVHLASDDGTTEPVTSKFVEEVRRREASTQRKSAWKTQGTGARFMGAAALWDESTGRRQPAFFTCVSAGRRRGEILYALSTGVVSGLFAYDVATGEEKRLAHDADGNALAIATSDDHSVVAFARRQKNGSCNLAVMRDDGGDWALVTDGDTLDGAPSWVPVGPEVTSGRHQLVFHSSGIGRDAAGQLAGFGPSEINLLDAEHGNLKTLVASATHDYLAPRMTRDGTLFAMRRPYRAGPPTPDASTVLKDGLLAPFRLMYAGFRYLDFFSMKYSGKPLTTSGNTKGRNVDARRLLERQNVAAAGDAEIDEDAMRAPADWVLVRRTPAGDETVVAKSVVAYDFSRDGRILVTDGLHVHRVDADGGSRRKLATARLVTSLVAL